MMREDEINRIIETTKKKIAISQFEKEKKENMKKKNKFNALKRIGIGTAAGVLLTIGSVGAYVGITGNTEILQKIGINIGEKYDEKKQSVEKAISGNGYKLNLVSVACDSSCIIMEMNVKLDNSNYKDIDFEIGKLTLTGDNITGSTERDLKISDSSASSLMEDGSIKIFKYISVKDPNLGGDGFLDEVFGDSNKANCKIEFSKLYDKNTNETISDEKMELDFDIEGKENDEHLEVNKTVKTKNISTEICYICKSSLGNYITLISSQNDFDINKENSIQKLEYVVKNSSGKEIKIVSRTYNISHDPDDLSNIYLETTLKLDDVSDDLNYDIDVQIGNDINIPKSKIEESLKSLEDALKYQEESEDDNINDNVNSENEFGVAENAPLDGELVILRKFNSNNHDGIDLGAQEGDSIYSIDDGVVVDVGFDEVKGKYILVQYDNEIQAFYGACSEVLKSVGDKVKSGEIIAKVGNTGHSTGPHLHFEILEDGVQVNPEDYLK